MNIVVLLCIALGCLNANCNLEIRGDTHPKQYDIVRQSLPSLSHSLAPFSWVYHYSPFFGPLALRASEIP